MGDQPSASTCKKVFQVHCYSTMYSGNLLIVDYNPAHVRSMVGVIGFSVCVCVGGQLFERTTPLHMDCFNC